MSKQCPGKSSQLRKILLGIVPMRRKLTAFIQYLLGKKSEVKDLETKDALLTKTVLDIHRKRSHSSFVTVPLFSLKQIHAIDRENAIAATDKRVQTLTALKNEILEQKHISKSRLNQYLPSVSAVKIVKESEDSYIAFEGNGRLVALQRVFTPEDQISLEVEEYHFKDAAKILRRIHRVRQLNQLL